jgi:hypothetical protein
MRVSVDLFERITQIEANLCLVFEDNRRYLIYAGARYMMYNLYSDFNSLIMENENRNEAGEPDNI